MEVLRVLPTHGHDWIRVGSLQMHYASAELAMKLVVAQILFSSDPSQRRARRRSQVDIFVKYHSQGINVHWRRVALA
jgi:hypothetical protein